MRAYHVGLVVLLAAVTPRATRAGDPMPGFFDTPYVSGLSHPTAIAFLPDGRLLITEKGGTAGTGTGALKLFDGTGTSTLLTLPVCTDAGDGPPRRRHPSGLRAQRPGLPLPLAARRGGWL